MFDGLPIARRAALIAVGILFVGCKSGAGAGDDDIERVSALTSQGSALGFEVLWTTSSGTASLSTVVSQGQKSLQLSGFTFAEATSPAFVLSAAVATSVGFDLWIPTPPANLNWFGGAEIFVSCPSQNINHAFVGYRDLLPFPQATFATISMTVPAGLQPMFQAGCSSAQIGIALSVAGGSPYRLDNFRLNPTVSPPTASILGMERTLDWSPSTGSLTASSLRTEGLQGLAAAGFTFAEIRGAPVKIVGLQSSTVGFDLMVPSQPAGTWPGQAMLYLTSVSRAVNHVFIGQVPLDNFVPGRFQTAVFTIPASVLQSLQGTVTDLAVAIGLNVASTSTTYRLDNVRFNPSRALCPHADGFVPAPASAAWQVYDTANPAGKVMTSSGTVTLSTRGTGFAAGGDSILSFYQLTSGDLDAAATVDLPAQSAATAGLMLRSGLFPTAPFVFVGVSNGKLALVRRVTGTQVTSILGSTVTGSKRFRLVKSGLNVSVFASSDGVTWQSLGAVTFSDDSSLEIGLVAASGNATTTAAANFHGFELRFADRCGRCGDGG
jgi:hypothetical protein